MSALQVGAAVFGIAELATWGPEVPLFVEEGRQKRAIGHGTPAAPGGRGALCHHLAACALSTLLTMSCPMARA